MLSIFLCACHRSSSIKKEERKLVEKFFEELLLDHGGAFTLFGSKPATLEDLIDISPENRDQLQKYLDAHPEVDYIQVERFLEEGWDVLKKYPIAISENYVLTEIDQQRYKEVVLLNVKSALQSMNDNIDIFLRVAGENFDPRASIDDLRKGNHEVWRKILTDYQCLGILLGYGRENARLFEKNIMGEPVDSYGASANGDPRIKADCYLNDIPFRIPIFTIFDKEESDRIVSTYIAEREQIKSFYSGKDFLDATLERLKIK